MLLYFNIFILLSKFTIVLKFRNFDPLDLFFKSKQYLSIFVNVQISLMHLVGIFIPYRP